MLFYVRQEKQNPIHPKSSTSQIMDPTELRKLGYYADNGYLVTPTGKFDLSVYTNAQSVNKTMHVLLKFLIWIVIINVATFLVMGGITMPFGFILLYLSFCWLNSMRFEVVGLTSQGSHVIAHLNSPIYKFSSNEDDIANGIVSLITNHNK